MRYKINEEQPERFKPVTVCITCETNKELETLYHKIDHIDDELNYDYVICSNLADQIERLIK